MKKLIQISIILSAITLMACEDTSNNSSSDPIAAATSPTPTPTPDAHEQRIAQDAAEKATLQCVRDLCGPEEKYFATRAEGPFGKLVPQDVKAFLNTEVDPRLSKMAGHSVKYYSEYYKFLDENLTSFRNDDFSQKQFALLLIRTLMVKIGPYLSKAVETQNGVTFVHFQKLPPTLVAANPALYEQAVTFLNALNGSKAFADVTKIGPANYDEYKNRIMGSGRNPGSLWAMHLSTKLLQVKTIESKLGKFEFADLNMDVLHKEIKGDVLSPREKIIFMSILQRTAGLTAFNEPSVEQAASSIAVDMPGLLEILNWKEQKSVISAFLAIKENNRFVTMGLKDACNEKVVQAIAAAPTEFKLKRAEQLLSGVKAAAKTAATEYFSGESLSKAQAAIDKVKFEKPKSEQEARRSIIGDLESVVGMVEKRNKIWTDLESSSDKASALLHSATLINQHPGNSLAETAKTLCDTLKPSVFEDQARQEGNDIIIRLGWQTTSFHQMGAGIMAHEIGHAVSNTANILTSNGQDYWKVRQCSTDLHKALAEGKDNKGNHSQFQEEDWADAFATTTIKILNKTWPYAENYACSILNIEDKEFSGNVLVSDNSKDIHSTSLFRAIQVHRGLGKELPATCQAAFGPKDAETISRTCAK